MLINKRSLSQKVNFFLLVLLCSSFYVFSEIPVLSSWSVIIISLLFFLVNLKKGISFIFFSRFYLIFFLFICYCFINAIWAVDPQEAISKGTTIAKIMICMLIVGCCYRGNDSIDDLLKAIMWSGPVIALYSIAQYGYLGLRQMAISATRLDTEFANINGIGIWMVFSIILFLYYSIKVRFRLFYLAGILPVVVMALSQSRTAWAAFLFGFVLLMFFSSFERKKSVHSLIRLLAVLLIITVTVLLLSRLSVFDGIRTRVNSMFISLGLKSGVTSEGSTASRLAYIEAGLRQFLKTPVGGIGIGNSSIIAYGATGHRTYLHNNYVELLACGGLIAFLLYYSIYVYLIIGLRKQKKQGNRYTDICLIMLFTSLLVDMGTVSYYTKENWLILSICALQLYEFGNRKNPQLLKSETNYEHNQDF